MSGSPPAQEPRPSEPMPVFHPGRMVLLVERSTEAGALLVSCPHLPGWRVSARGPAGIAEALERGWREHAVRAYANSRGEPYDLEHLADVEKRTKPPGTGQWEEQPDGRWRSPGGYLWSADSATVQRLKARREASA